MQAQQALLTSWGKLHSKTLTYRPERQRDLKAIMLQQHPNGIIAYAKGRSYGDVALNENGHAILTERLNRFLSFNDQTGELVCEPGVTFADLLTTFLPRGYFAPVCPGTAFVTLGGAVANDIHGKNHDRVGSFGEHVLWLELLLPNGISEIVSPKQNPTLFYATIGGLGLTGLIRKIAIKLIPTLKHVQIRKQRISNLDNFLEQLIAARDEAYYSVGWIDGNARGKSLGRGILTTATPVSDEMKQLKKNKSLTVPIQFPNFVLNPITINCFNSALYHSMRKTPLSKLVSLGDFLFPLDNLLHWNRMYGKRGFYQFQCVIPDAQAQQALADLMETISKSRAASFLSVIKTLGKAGTGLLSFAKPGVTLALDFPNTKEVKTLLKQLEMLVLKYQGRVYLAKDACLAPESLQLMYPNLSEFQQVLCNVDPKHVMQSNLSRRLGITS